MTVTEDTTNSDNDTNELDSEQIAQILAKFSNLPLTQTKIPELPVFERIHVPVNVKKLPHYEGLPNLITGTEGSSGIDLFAATIDPIPLNTIGSKAVIPTGISIELPGGCEAQIRPRSGLASKHGITVLNSPGTIDSDYRGEIMVILINLSTKKFRVERGMRIAQMIVGGPLPLIDIHYRNELTETIRSDNGFGSTGI